MECPQASSTPETPLRELVQAPQQVHHPTLLPVLHHGSLLGGLLYTFLYPVYVAAGMHRPSRSTLFTFGQPVDSAWASGHATLQMGNASKLTSMSQCLRRRWSGRTGTPWLCRWCRHRHAHDRCSGSRSPRWQWGGKSLNPLPSIPCCSPL
jgi:hypothetical protein